MKLVRQIAGLIGIIFVAILGMSVLYGVVDLLFLGAKTPFSIFGIVGVCFVGIMFLIHSVAHIDDGMDLLKQVFKFVKSKIAGGKR